MLLGGTLLAQEPSFEAASVKPMQSGRGRVSPLHGGPGTDAPGQLTGAATFKALLIRAYELKEYQISGPAWMDSERYEIAAKIPAGVSQAIVARMLQTLLAERFHLTTHREKRELPVYALRPAKGGPKIKESAPPDPNAAGKPAAPKFTMGADGFPEILAGSDVPRTYEAVVSGTDGIMYKVWARRETMQQLADYLSARVERPVLDLTDLRDQYDFSLAFAVESAGGIIPRAGPPPDMIESHRTPVMPEGGLPIFSAVQVQLGLRLEPRKGAVEMLIVDRVEKTPAEN